MALSLKILALLAAFSSLAHAESSPAVGVRHINAYAAALAVEEKIDEPICRDGDGRSRQEIHAQMILMAAEAFGRELAYQPSTMLP